MSTHKKISAKFNGYKRNIYWCWFRIRWKSWKNLRIRNFSWSYKIYISYSLVDNLVFHAFFWNGFEVSNEFCALFDTTIEFCQRKFCLSSYLQFLLKLKWNAQGTATKTKEPSVLKACLRFKNVYYCIY